MACEMHERAEFQANLAKQYATCSKAWKKGKPYHIWNQGDGSGEDGKYDDWKLVTTLWDIQGNQDWPPRNVKLSDEWVLLAVLHLSGHMRGNKWPADFDQNGHIRRSRIPCGRAPVADAFGANWFIIYRGFYVLCGDAASRSQCWLIRKDAASKSARLSAGQVFARPGSEPVSVYYRFIDTTRSFRVGYGRLCETKEVIWAPRDLAQCTLIYKTHHDSLPDLRSMLHIQALAKDISGNRDDTSLETSDDTHMTAEGASVKTESEATVIFLEKDEEYISSQEMEESEAGRTNPDDNLSKEQTPPLATRPPRFYTPTQPIPVVDLTDWDQSPVVPSRLNPAWNPQIPRVPRPEPAAPKTSLASNTNASHPNPTSSQHARGPGSNPPGARSKPANLEQQAGASSNSHSSRPNPVSFGPKTKPRSADFPKIPTGLQENPDSYYDSVDDIHSMMLDMHWRHMTIKRQIQDKGLEELSSKIQAAQQAALDLLNGYRGMLCLPAFETVSDPQ